MYGESLGPVYEVECVDYRYGHTHPSRLAYADQTNCTSPSSEIMQSGVRSSRLAVMNAQASNWEKRQHIDTFVEFVDYEYGHYASNQVNVR